MLRERNVLTMRPAEAGRHFQRLRATVSPPVPPDALVVVAVLGSSLSKQEKKNVITQARFKAICGEVFQEKGGLMPQERHSGTQAFVACAWFPNENASAPVRAAVAIRSSYLTKEVRDQRPVLLSVGSDECRACRLLWLAGDNQGVIDPAIWNRLEAVEQQIARDAGVHEPMVRDLTEVVEKAATAAVCLAPLESSPGKRLFKQDVRSAVHAAR